MKINLFSFSHAKCSGNIRKLVYCTDGVRKISPLQGDGNCTRKIADTKDNMSKEDKSPARGRKLLFFVFFIMATSCKEDKSPARGRKQEFPSFLNVRVTRKEDKSPARGRKLVVNNASCFRVSKEDKSPARGRKLQEYDCLIRWLL